MIKVTFLGTGSAVPTARKNHPAILLNYKSENILFDCGEGTQRQFRKANISPSKLTRIFISHWHGDHVLGIPGLLYTLNLNDYKKELKIYGPKGTKKFMREIMKTYANVNKLNLKIYEVTKKVVVDENDFKILAEKMSHGTKCLAYSFIEKDKLRIDKKKLAKLKIGKSPKFAQLVKGKNIVIDGKKINAKSLTYLQKGKKISIILDTRENKNINNLVKNSDLLVCESTFFDETELAKEYGHLTVGQTAKIAKKAKVEKLVLTHLSQRYENKEKEFLKVAQKIFKNSVLAKDLMIVDL
ncbi:MAG: ribonuclease Z [Nanoarchaeota archaeon]|nr:ribonuclease Z [Nanoarchaeota archaeon]